MQIIRHTVTGTVLKNKAASYVDYVPRHPAWFRDLATTGINSSLHKSLDVSDWSFTRLTLDHCG